MNPTAPEFSVLTRDRLPSLGEAMNKEQIAAVTLMPMFAIELKLTGMDPKKGPEFAVNAQAVDEGNNIYLARATAEVLREALGRISAKLDELIEQDQKRLQAQGGALKLDS